MTNSSDLAGLQPVENCSLLTRMYFVLTSHIKFTEFENLIGCVDVCMYLPYLDRDKSVMKVM